MTTVENNRDYQLTDEVAIREAHWKVRAREIVFDVGCAHGSYSSPALAAGAMVYAIDCDGEPLDELRSRYPRDGHLVTIHAGVGNGGERPADLAADLLAANFIVPEINAEVWTTVDEIVAEYHVRRVDRIKIDVEGMELDVLRGAGRTLARWHPKLLIEDHSKLFASLVANGSTRKIRALLREADYRTRLVGYEGEGPDRDYLVCAYGRR